MNPIRIFFSYTRADEAPVKELYYRLKAQGFAPWMDTEDLLPGERFEYVIRQAIRRSDFFLACLTSNSVNRRGVIQREINEALNVLQEKLDEDIYLIPVRLETCEVPERLRAFHWADLYDEQGFDKLLRAIRSQIENRHFDASLAHEGQVKSIGANADEAWTDPATGMEFVWIPPGKFWMGATEADRQAGYDYKSEQPRHEVQISAGFWLGTYPVTQEQWLAFMVQNPSRFNKKKVGKDWRRHPVEHVSWNECQEFLRKLNAQNPPLPLPGGDTEPPPGRGRGGLTFRLPSEAEWEYACRAGTETIWSFGNDKERLAEYAWYKKNSGGRTHPVGQLQPNAWGLYDMYGNVWEWCADIYDPDAYRTHSPQNPLISGGGSNRVLRCGSWINVPGYVRSANRDYGYMPPSSHNHIGLRLVRNK